MKLKSIKAKNLYSYPWLYLVFNYIGTTLILGHNLDQATSNGSGKTSILKIIFYALYGKDLAGSTLDSVINRNSVNGGIVEILFSDRGNEYRILRYRDYKLDSKSYTDNGGLIERGSLIEDKIKGEKGTGVQFFINDESFNGQEGEGSKSTQSIIEEKLRMSPRLFLSSVMTAQKSSNSFLLADDTDKKELLSSLLDLQIYADAFEEIKKEIKEQESKIAESGQRLEQVDSKLEDKAAEISNLSGKQEEFETSRSIKLLELSKRGENLKFQIEQAEKMGDLKPVDTTNLRNEITELDRSVSNLLSRENEESGIQDLLRSGDQKRSQILSKISIHEMEIKTIASETASLEKLSGLPPAHDEAFLSIQMSDINRELSAHPELPAKLEALRSSEDQARLAVNQRSHSLGQLESEQIRLRSEKLKIENASHCPTCKKPIEQEDKNHIDNEIERISVLLVATADGIHQERDSLKNSEIKLALAMEQVEACRGRIAVSDKLCGDLNLLSSQLETACIAADERSSAKAKILERSLRVSVILKDTQDLNERLSKHDLILKTLTERLSLAQEARKERAEQETFLREKRRELSSHELANERAAGHAVVIANLKSALQIHGSDFGSKKQELSPYQALIESAQDMELGLKDRKLALKERSEELQSELKYLQFWKNGFSPVGIRSFISDEVIGLLNEKVKENLDDLFDGALFVQFSSESLNSKGIASNTISTQFFLNGKMVPRASLSGGELQRCVLATDLALSAVAEARAGTKINVKFLDEPFEGIDSAGQIKAFKLFNRIANAKDGFFIISHDPAFQAFCTSTVHILKKNSQSQIVSAEDFDSQNLGLSQEMFDADQAPQDSSGTPAMPKKKTRVKRGPVPASQS